jgi:hypothetical protein
LIIDLSTLSIRVPYLVTPAFIHIRVPYLVTPAFIHIRVPYLVTPAFIHIRVPYLVTPSHQVGLNTTLHMHREKYDELSGGDNNDNDGGDGGGDGGGDADDVKEWTSAMKAFENDVSKTAVAVAGLQTASASATTPGVPPSSAQAFLKVRSRAAHRQKPINLLFVNHVFHDNLTIVHLRFIAAGAAVPAYSGIDGSPS